MAISDTAVPSGVGGMVPGEATDLIVCALLDRVYRFSHFAPDFYNFSYSWRTAARLMVILQELGWYCEVIEHTGYFSVDIGYGIHTLSQTARRRQDLPLAVCKAFVRMAATLAMEGEGPYV